MASNFETAEITNETLQLEEDLARIEYLIWMYKNVTDTRPADTKAQAEILLSATDHLQEAVSIFLPLAYRHVQSVPELRVPHSAFACAMRMSWIRYCQSWCTLLHIIAGPNGIETILPNAYLDPYEVGLVRPNIVSNDIFETAVNIVSKTQQKEILPRDRLLSIVRKIVVAINSTEAAHSRVGNRAQLDTIWRNNTPTCAELLMGSIQRGEIFRVTLMAMTLVGSIRRFSRLLSGYLDRL